MDEPINWHDLEIFHAVMEQGSFSGAARVLGLSQPTVSRHIEGLERRLGRELFMRNGAGLEPTSLHRVVPEYRFISPDFWLTMHGGLRRNRPIRAVWDWLVEHLPVTFEQTRSAGS
jgi:DNA-binding transcriptional LysR family regulator